VVIVSGYSQQSMLESRGIKYTAASSLTQGLNLVQHRDQDVFFSGWEGAAYEAKGLGYLDKLIFTRPTTVTVKDFHVCFSKKYAESDKWRLLLNKGLEKIRIQGQMTSIKQKYGIENSY
jgi:polar amino acid transport system substrate-binding protein